MLQANLLCELHPPGLGTLQPLAHVLPLSYLPREVHCDMIDLDDLDVRSKSVVTGTLVYGVNPPVVSSL